VYLKKIYLIKKKQNNKTFLALSQKLLWILGWQRRTRQK